MGGEAIRNLARQGQHVAKPQDLLKDPYVLDAVNEFLADKKSTLTSCTHPEFRPSFSTDANSEQLLIAPLGRSDVTIVLSTG
jgi:hypothetical protein